MSAGFLASRETVLAAIERMGVACCGYSASGKWADRCDCKYGVVDTKKWPTIAERGNGCPELRSVFEVIQALTDDEWARLIRRAGGIPSDSLFGGVDIASRLHRADAAARMAAANIAEVRTALEDGAM